MTELETAIREALNERADAASIRHTALVGRHKRRWAAPLLAAALVIALVAISLVLVARNHGSTLPAAQKSSSFVGYSWRLVQIDDQQGRLTLPASTKAEVEFGQDRTMFGDDTVNSLQAHYRIVATGYQPSRDSVSDNGFAGPVSATLKRTLFAIGSCFSSARLEEGSKPPPSAPIKATVHGDRLTLHTGDGVLTFVRAGPASGH